MRYAIPEAMRASKTTKLHRWGSMALRRKTKKMEVLIRNPKYSMHPAYIKRAKAAKSIFRNRSLLGHIGFSTSLADEFRRDWKKTIPEEIAIIAPAQKGKNPGPGLWKLPSESTTLPMQM